MRILLINVCIRFDSEIKHIPVGLSCIATALKLAGFSIDILDIGLYRYTDAQIDEFLEKNNDYDLVGLGNIVSGYRYTKNLAAQIKKLLPRSLLVVGNTVATAIPGLLLRCVPQINIAVIGEGDRTIVEIARAVADKKDWRGIDGIAYRKGNDVVLTRAREALNIEDIPFPDYSLFDVEKYISVSPLAVSEPLPPIHKEEIRGLPLNTARGCVFNCTFCGHAFKQYKYRYYPFSRLVEYIKSLQERYGINYIFFWDELTFFSVNRLKELCSEIERQGVHFYWSIATRANIFTRKDLDILKKSRELGALSVGGSLESSSPEILKAMRKDINIERYKEQVEVVRKAGLQAATSLVFGYPQETEDTIKNTLELCRQLAIYPSAGFVLPLPGTEIYDYALKHGLIKDEEQYLLRVGDRQDLHINLTQMPDERLYGVVKEELIKLKNNLNIQLSDENVIKTKTYKISKVK